MRALLEQEVFRLDSYTNLVLRVFGVFREFPHDDLQLRQLHCEDSG